MDVISRVILTKTSNVLTVLVCNHKGLLKWQETVIINH